jgi:hypothetical protein
MILKAASTRGGFFCIYSSGFTFYLFKTQLTISPMATIKKGLGY